MVLRTSGHPLHGLGSEAFLIIGFDGYALWGFVVAEGFGLLLFVGDFAGIGIDAVDIFVGELRLLVDLL